MSTEFKIGLDGNRNSSKVLKPPGGGSSDIFGVKSADVENTKSNMLAGSTKNRIFGEVASTNTVSTSVDMTTKKDVATPSSVSKKHVRRNPITGEGISSENSEPGSEKGVNDTLISEKANDLPTVETPKAVQTSIRVRNPPGGKSSGIF